MSLRIHGNRLLKTLPGQATRPTPARVREALFNIWQGQIEGCRWLDLCAGSGAMGAEALCRGAAIVIGIEQSSKACEVIRQNWQQVARSPQQFQIIRGDVTHLEKLAGQKFDRIYFDPPYASELYASVLGAIAEQGLLANGGEIAVEHSPGMELPQVGLNLYRLKIYGNTAIGFYNLDALQRL
jgi:16S rRNA (guanine966-N2)-methyltransferase